MKNFLLCSFLLGCASPVLAADVGVTVTVGQPGFYGRIDVGSYPRPVIVYPQPVVIVPARIAVVAEPVYLRVPPGHAKNWAKHCSRYDACGQRVYFVQDNWYRNVYVPAYRDRGGPGYDDSDRGRGDHEHEGRHEGKHKDKHKDKHDKHKGKDKD